MDGERSDTSLINAPIASRFDASINTLVASHSAAEVTALNEDQIVQRVLVDLQRQIDLMLEYRVREALIPALTRATDALVLEARNELASTLRAVVSKSVAQELSRLREVRRQP